MLNTETQKKLLQEFAATVFRDIKWEQCGEDKWIGQTEINRYVAHFGDDYAISPYIYNWGSGERWIYTILKTKSFWKKEK